MTRSSTSLWVQGRSGRKVWCGTGPHAKRSSPSPPSRPRSGDLLSVVEGGSLRRPSGAWGPVPSPGEVGPLGAGWDSDVPCPPEVHLSTTTPPTLRPGRPFTELVRVCHLFIFEGAPPGRGRLSSSHPLTNLPRGDCDWSRWVRPGGRCGCGWGRVPAQKGTSLESLHVSPTPFSGSNLRGVHRCCCVIHRAVPYRCRREEGRVDVGRQDPFLCRGSGSQSSVRV